MRTSMCLWLRVVVSGFRFRAHIVKWHHQSHGRETASRHDAEPRAPSIFMATRMDSWKHDEQVGLQRRCNGGDGGVVVVVTMVVMAVMAV